MLATPEHIGADLRAERQRQGLSLTDLAEELFVKEAYLAALEAGARPNTLGAEPEGGLPSVGYVLGYVRAYANHVGLSGEVAVDRYKAEMAIPENLRLRDAPHIITRRRRHIPRGLISACAVMIGAIALAMYYGSNSEVAEAAAPMETVEITDTTLPGPDMFILRAETASWIEVRARDGEVILSAILKPGQEVSVPRNAAPIVHVRDAGAVNLAVGTRDLGPLGERGQSLHDVELLSRLTSPAAGGL
jgi:hypothetical protein